MIEEVFTLAAEAGTSAGSPIWLTVVALIVGTGGVSTALVTSFANRKKTSADTSSSLVQATAQILGPYSTAIEMQKVQIVELIEKLKKKDLEIQSLEGRVRDCESKLAIYERLHGPLVVP